MLRLEALEVIQRFRQPGGAEFVSFCNKMIRARCAAAGIAGSSVSMCSRTDARDGGVDTRVDVALPGDSSGYFSVPTVWQFRAAEQSNVSPGDLKKEVNKKHAKQRIEEGHGYRFCVCSHLTDERKGSLLVELREAVAEIREDAPAPMVLAVDDLVELVNSFPALVLEYRPGLEGMCVLFDPWGQSVRAVTPAFVAATGFGSTKEIVLAHADFAKEVRSPVLTLYGAPGAGKTRAAYECLAELPAAASVVLYTTSEDDALELANMLVNQPGARAILVADECSLATGQKLARTLMGFRDRVRCLCIDNDVDRIATPAPELVIPKLGSMDLEKILRANFKEIPYDRIRVYSEYCDGSVRLAADMCANYDAEIAQARTLGPVLNRIDEYFRVRLTDHDQREAVEAIALLKRVKYKGEPPTELDLVCELARIQDRAKFERALSQVKASPGWIEQGALYYRVTPAIVAMIAFGAAWGRWASGDENNFLGRLPASIQESFLRRVSESASPEVRQTVQLFFRRFADDFTPRDLGDPEMVDRLVCLIETDPRSYLPALRRVIETASNEDLKRGPEWTGHSWGPRRQLVWTMENFISFPEHFDDCEAILFRLAQSECEPRIGNNATKTWQHLFRLQMSGTSLPLTDRLERLRSRMEDATDMSAEVLSGALGEILDTMGTRVLGSSVVGGRVPPPDWYPSGAEELKQSVKAGLLFLDQAARHPLPIIAREAKDSLVGAVDALTRLGWLSELRPLLVQTRLDEADRASLARRLMRILTWGKDPENKAFSPEYVAALSDWIAELKPKSLHARLVGAVGGAAIEHYGREKEWEAELDQLSAQLLANPVFFDAELAWLYSAEAKSAFELGSRLGALDKSSTLIDKILGTSKTGEIGLSRGYVAGLLYEAKIDPQIVIPRLDRLEEADPVLSFQIALAGGSRVKVFDRAVRLIKHGKLSAYHLRNFTFWVGEIRVSNEQVAEALRLLIPLAASDSLASDIIVDFFGARLHVGLFAALVEAETELVWEATTSAAKNPGRDAFWLGEALKAVAPTNPPLAIQLAADALVGDNLNWRDQAEQLLQSWAAQNPKEVMDAVGALMLDEEKGWRFFASKFRIFKTIPDEIIIEWLDSVGVKGAQKIARHLPTPFIDAKGEPRVPRVTEYVLSRFEDDRLTFSEFCAGTHSLQVYRGDIASQREQEADRVAPFLRHKLRRIREWAQYEQAAGAGDARHFREIEDELDQ